MKLTPMLEQYFKIKRQVPDAILFYRLGDFYEMFFEDAERAAPILDLVLTARGRGGESEAPMCGVPYHAADQYVAKLVRQGFRVALCDQIENPSEAKGIVRREIIRIVTPGTAVESSLLDRQNCYLLGLAPREKALGAAYLDVSTGDFFVKSYRSAEDPRLRDDVARFNPREAVFPRSSNALVGALTSLGLVGTPVEDSYFDPEGAQQLLSRHFKTHTLKGFGLENADARVSAAGGALRYAAANHKRELDHVSRLRLENDTDSLILDAATLQNLEVLESRESGSSLLQVIDQTSSPMGARTLRRWLARPLRSRERIFDRHDAVAELSRSPSLAEALAKRLHGVADLERLASRVSLRTAGPRECLTLASSLRAVAQLRVDIEVFQGSLLKDLHQRLDPLLAVAEKIEGTLSEDSPISARDGGVIRSGLHTELDQLRVIAHDSKSVLLRIEAQERERTGIPSLKIRFNSVFGYYIEVSKTNLPRVPAEYIRKQTLVNAERFITPELKELEEKIVGAEQKSIEIECRLYQELLDAIADHSLEILATAAAAGELDGLTSFARTALRRRYVRPELSEEAEICIEEGRHAVVEAVSQQRFVPNSTAIRRVENGIQIITGPNMGGKSTYLRQVALIVLLNQAGSFVPASQARLGIFDRIFTRVGASDNLARGESTFMVEMNETANILNNATEHSLVVLDEVGRGTATFDGLSLAWAILEFLHDSLSRSPITLFATHYHELTDLSRTRARIVNLNVSVKEWNEQIIFLRKIVPGAADKSYGIQVARLAGIPRSIIARAREILATLERKERDVLEETSRAVPRSPQLSLFSAREEALVRALEAADLDQMTPIEALNKLQELKKIVVPGPLSPVSGPRTGEVTSHGSLATSSETADPGLGTRDPGTVTRDPGLEK